MMLKLVGKINRGIDLKPPNHHPKELVA